MTRLALENGHKTNTCDDEIRLCAQNKNIVLGSIVNTIVVT